VAITLAVSPIRVNRAREKSVHSFSRVGDRKSRRDNLSMPRLEHAAGEGLLISGFIGRLPRGPDPKASGAQLGMENAITMR